MYHWEFSVVSACGCHLYNYRKYVDVPKGRADVSLSERTMQRAASYVVDPNVPMNQKTWGVDHYIMEDVGPGPEFLQLCFKRPEDLGYDESILGTENCESMVCAVGKSSCAAVMTHKWHPYKNGVLFESRFWIGYRMDEDGNVVKAIPEGVSIPPFVPQGLFAHNIKEFTNLAAILPTLYAEEKGTF